MKSSNFTRRRFLKSTAAAALSIPALSSLTSQAAFAASGTSEHTLINIFLRGGMDSLSALIPYQERSYYELRPSIAIPPEGLIPVDRQFAIHKAMTPLLKFYKQGELAFIAATGLGPISTTRSHFDAQRRMESGADNYSQADGWIGRYLNSTSVNTDASFRAIGHKRVQKSLQGYDPALGFANLSDFKFKARGLMRNAEAGQAIKELYSDINHPLLTLQSSNAFQAVAIAANKALGSSTKPANYGPTQIDNALHQIAELMISGVGLEAACVDMGGWDLHKEMGTWQTGSMQLQLSSLSTALTAFYEEINGLQQKVTIVVMSEFGRRVSQNDSNGTDHGKGGMMMVMGKGVNGNQVYGDWPGLDTLDQNDLAITTDYRQVLAEIIGVRIGRIDLVNAVFPGFNAGQYLGIAG